MRRWTLVVSWGMRERAVHYVDRRVSCVRVFVVAVMERLTQSGRSGSESRVVPGCAEAVDRARGRPRRMALDRYIFTALLSAQKRKRRKKRRREERENPSLSTPTTAG